MRSLIVLAATLAAVYAMLPVAAAADAMRVGPVYTAADPTHGMPVFAEFQILVDLPLATESTAISTDAFRLRTANGGLSAAKRVQTLAATGHGIAVVVMLDMSGSMKGEPLNAIRSGLARFAGDAAPQDRIAIETVADDNRWDANWGDTPEKLKQALSALTTRGHLTRLWDGLIEALGRFPADPITRRITVISDGHDEGSTHAFEEVIATAGRLHISVDAIGITRTDPVYLANLQRLADETGGKFQAAKDTAELEKITGSGIDRLKALPVVSFEATDVPADGNSHKFEIVWDHDGAETEASVTAVVPKLTNIRGVSKRVLFITSATAAILLIGAGVLFAQRRKAETMTPVSAAPADAAFASVPVVDPVRSVAHPVARAMPARAVSSLPRRPMVEPAAGLSREPSSEKTVFSACFQAPAPGRPAAWLVGEAGICAGKSFPVDAPEFWIGSRENNHLRIDDDPTTSANHACIVFDHDALGIFDHQSTNGTRVNDEAVRETRRLLRPGDRIRIGRSTFLLSVSRNEQKLP